MHLALDGYSARCIESDCARFDKFAPTAKHDGYVRATNIVSPNKTCDKTKGSCGPYEDIGETN